ncbi:MAG: hypothetical protein Q4A31_11760 [Corynebacterium sp.]|uniref:hypothetical protein n=1 Tax=Corynebacterium sp. TaxID=1720 RepID=UPI0026DD1377|nr:hypothetical protein [Corynebacterium sp.]MDO4762588.1 hypothetical protein [Corynebacterium sp.]
MSVNPPQLRFCVVGQSFLTTDLLQAGHVQVALHDAPEMVILGVADSVVEQQLEALADVLRPNTIVLNHCLALAPEVSGCLDIAVLPQRRGCAVCTFDELGAVVAELLLQPLGVSVTQVAAEDWAQTQALVAWWLVFSAVADDKARGLCEFFAPALRDARTIAAVEKLMGGGKLYRLGVDFLDGVSG